MIDDVFTFSLMALSTVLTIGAVTFLGVGVFHVAFERFFQEVKREAGPQGGVSGASSVLVRRLGAFNRRFMWPRYELTVRRKLVKGGEPQGYQPEDIMALQEIGFVAALLLGVFVCVNLDISFGLALLLALGGALYPLIWVNDQVKKRHHLITRALPYNLDLLTLSVEAGLDFTGALAKVVEKGKPGPLRDELQLVLKQLKMGKTREEALRNLVARVDLPPLTSFVNALIQADKMGTSLGKVLRIQSTQMRIDRTTRAEKLAQQAPVKMLFPLIACIFPTVFMVLFGPIVFAFMFGDITGGGG